jgi:hypothetical protein
LIELLVKAGPADPASLLALVSQALNKSHLLDQWTCLPGPAGMLALS